MVLDQLKRYPEAAAAYESALKLRPGEPGLETRLGTAYLRAGNDAAATTAFDKAIQSDHTPNAENDIAYELAEADKNLLLALD